MRRVLVIGNSGGGKSTLARRLGDKLGLPVIHLDILFWKPGWVESDKAEFADRVAAALQAPVWVSDGNFGSNYHVRLPRADTVIWIDLPPWLCLFRAIKRAVTYRGGGRPDLTPGCDETIDFQFYGFILNFRRKHQPRLEAALAEHGAHVRLYRLRSDREIAAFLAQA
jgi:adenylate kinase family enzyme